MRKLVFAAAAAACASMAFAEYEAKWESLDSRPVPQWWQDAKFGIFIHWGPYAVPAFGNITKDGKFAWDCYAEWYQGFMLKGKKPYLEHHEKFYHNAPYGNFAAQFKAEHFDPAEWARLFKQAGAKYVVLTSKHHDGYALWPSPESPYYNAVERMELGIAEPLPLSPGSYALEPVRENNRFYIIETDEEQEYYLLECRDNEGWDAEIGGTGLLIYHIDQSRRPAGLSDTYKKVFSAEQRWIYNEVNCRPDRQCADLVEADPAAEPDSYGSQVKRVFWPQQGRAEFSAMTDPAFVFWSGTESTLSLTQIRKQGNSVLFTVVGGMS